VSTKLPTRQRWIAACALLAWFAVPAAGQAPSLPATRVVILGTGTPNADPDRSGPALAVVRGNTAYLVDAGPGVVRRAAAAARKHGMRALEASQLRLLFVTHLHSDHTLGLPDLIFSPWVLERDVPLVVYGPPGIRAMVDHVLAAYEADVRNRLDGLEPANETGYKVEVHEIHSSGVVRQDSALTVRAFAVPHGDWAEGESFGYRFEAPDRTIVVSGDTRSSEAVVAACAGCDVLVHEVYSAVRFQTRPAEWRRYHARAHTSTIELAALAARAAPKLLVLYHQLYWGTTDEGLIEEVRRAGYHRRAVSARDLDAY
jgi:ribonuclease BN (tRNA processing enzyme)